MEVYASVQVTGSGSPVGRAQTGLMRVARNSLRAGIVNIEVPTFRAGDGAGASVKMEIPVGVLSVFVEAVDAICDLPMPSPEREGIGNED